jgi:hypothetical protein
MHWVYPLYRSPHIVPHIVFPNGLIQLPLNIRVKSECLFYRNFRRQIIQNTDVIIDPLRFFCSKFFGFFSNLFCTATLFSQGTTPATCTCLRNGTCHGLQRARAGAGANHVYIPLQVDMYD